jgi:hypothetical protein
VRILGAILCLSFFAVAQAQTVTVFDDALQNSFDGPDYSFGGGFDFNATAFVHTGAKSVSITGHNFNALSFAHVPGGVPTSLSAATTPVLRFWVNGGAGSGQQFHINLQNGGVIVGSKAALDTYIAGGGFAAGVWRQVTINLTQAPFNAVNFDRIDIQSDADAVTTAPTAYFDDIVLGQVSVTPTSAIQIDHDVTVASMTSDRFTWQDSLGHPRVASLAHNDVAPFNGSYGGAMREYKFQLSNGQTRTAVVTTYGNAGYGGFGYVTLHSSRFVGCAGDDSPLGMGYGGHWQRVFEGKHHVIFRFTQLYPRNCPTTGPVVTRYLPVTIDWVFSTGRDNPLWAVNYDVDLIAETGQAPVAAGTYYDDSRGPYGEFAIDGEGFTDLNGVSWGDRYKFITTNAAGTGTTLDSTWNWTAANTVPFIKEWLDGPLTGTNTHDATMGVVQTQTIDQQDAGGARDPAIGTDIRGYWGKTDADNVHTAGAHKIPDGNNWPYQAYGNSLDFEYPGASNNARMTWKTQFGFIGQSSYTTNNGGPNTTAPGYPKKSYSTYVVLGQHTTVPEPVDAQVTQVETIQSVTVSASIGSVVTSGPAGITRADNVTYAPAGYNHVYGALAFNASGNALDANIAVGNGSLKNPMIIIGNYTAGDPQQVKLAGTTLVADSDYFASPRASNNELWITLNRTLSGATNHLEILNPSGVPAAPVGVVAAAITTTRVDITWTAVGGASSYQIDRKAAGGSFAQIATSGTNSYSDMTAAANTAYLYQVRAVNGSGPSANSAPDLATTVIFTDSPLNAGTVVKAVHLAQLRTAVNAVRALAGLGAAGFTDAATAGTPIRAVHVTELRTAVDAARAALSLSTGGYTDGSLAGVRIKAVHFSELRARVQ